MIAGFSLIGSTPPQTGEQSTLERVGEAFRAVDPARDEALDPVFYSATAADVARAAQLAQRAFATYKLFGGARKAEFLRAIAAKLENGKAAIIQRAGEETALPPARIEGELARTVFQLRMFAALVEEGSWVEARIDHGDASRQPLAKPDGRSMLRPLGPVAVFGAANFPLAYSVAGGDTASALAAGCPVIVKAHPAHPGTSEIVGRMILHAARETQMPDGIFALLFDAKYEIGLALVRDARMKAVGFTGSRAGGLALIAAAQGRAQPIPVFAEMSSINPIFILPGALAERASPIASGLHASITQGVGQFCTNPGLILLPGGTRGDEFLNDLEARMRETAPATMLTRSIGAAYEKGIEKLAQAAGVATRVRPDFDRGTTQAGAALFETSAKVLLEPVFTAGV